MSKELEAKAKAILNANWRKGFTIPSKRLYPFQWNWDSGFIALGYLQFNMVKAVKEVHSLFKGQWENGMLPHILFHSKSVTPYFPDAKFWQSNLHPQAPKNLSTSGITQPPIHGFILEELFNNCRSHPIMLEFVDSMYPKVVKLHDYLYHQRDPQREGLVYIQHNWESGLDNAPMWDQPLRNIDLESVKIPAYQRADIKNVDLAQRPTQDDYDRYIYLVEEFKRLRYQDKLIAKESPFLIQDPNFNAILIRSNESLIRLGEDLGRDTAQIKEWQQQSIQQFNHKLWDEGAGKYQGYDLVAQKALTSDGILGYLPLNSPAPGPQRAQMMVDALFKDYVPTGMRLVPSFNPQHANFDSKKYWRGPVWINTNWLLWQGLLRYGHLEEAQKIKQDTLELIQHLGFYEYFEPSNGLQTAQGYGSDEFSWTAALYLNFINHNS